VNGPQVKRAVEDYGRKLFSALHYKEAGRILPQTGGIAWRWWSNVQVIDGELPAHFVARFRGEPTLMRRKQLLKDQFNYRYTVTRNGENWMYITEFRRAFVIAGVVAFDYKFLKKNAPSDAVILRLLPST
jgi:hypothetical protein